MTLLRLHLNPIAYFRPKARSLRNWPMSSTRTELPSSDGKAWISVGLDFSAPQSHNTYNYIDIQTYTGTNANNPVEFIIAKNPEVKRGLRCRHWGCWCLVGWAWDLCPRLVGCCGFLHWISFSVCVFSLSVAFRVKERSIGFRVWGVGGLGVCG